MFMKLLEKRRSIRKYADQAVEPEKIQVLIEAALRSPGLLKPSNPEPPS
jgi:nitroreductase